jgi:hypothetical protein
MSYSSSTACRLRSLASSSRKSDDLSCLALASMSAIASSRHFGSGTIRRLLSYVPYLGLAIIKDRRTMQARNSLSVSRLSGRLKRALGENSPLYSAGPASLCAGVRAFFASSLALTSSPACTTLSRLSFLRCSKASAVLVAL